LRAGGDGGGFISAGHRRRPQLCARLFGLADTYNVAPSYIPIASKQAELLSDEAARKAVELDDSLPEAHSALAFGLANEWNGKKRSPNFAVPLP